MLIRSAWKNILQMMSEICREALNTVGLSHVMEREFSGLSGEKTTDLFGTDCTGKLRS